MTVSSAGLSTELAAARRCDHLAEGEAQRRARQARRAARRLHPEPSPVFGRGGMATPMRLVFGIRRVLRAALAHDVPDGSLRPQSVSTR